MKHTETLVERHEYKYRIPASLIPAIRQNVRRYCEIDPACAGGSYVVSSLYFDSPNRVLYRQSRGRRPRRLKLRVRRYVDGPLFLEVKQRTKAVNVKRRVAIDPQRWPDILFDSSTMSDCTLSSIETERLGNFLSLYLRLHAEPAVVVRYSREAYVSRVDRYARVTFDRSLEGMRPTGYAIPIADNAGWVRFDDPSQFELPFSATVLELKCTTAVPLWMTDLVERFNLRPLGFSKYAAALDGIRCFPHDVAPLREPSRWITGQPW